MAPRKILKIGTSPKTMSTNQATKTRGNKRKRALFTCFMKAKQKKTKNAGIHKHKNSTTIDWTFKLFKNKRHAQLNKIRYPSLQRPETTECRNCTDWRRVHGTNRRRSRTQQVAILLSGREVSEDFWFFFWFFEFGKDVKQKLFPKPAWERRN